MKTTTIKLSKGQYLGNIEPFKSTGIPSNCILYKEVTGCGATESEIRADRNSIIVVPHQPVIKSKVKNHNRECDVSFKIFGVRKGISDYDIEQYLNSKAIYKKILTTPEGLAKILRVFENDLQSLYSDYFFLLDECERIVTDVSYRGKITAPVEIFSLFENKALVSATPLEFSHPVLSKLNRIIIKPDYDYRKNISVIGTNSVADTLKIRLDELASAKPVFIFINSTTCILDMIDILNLRDQSYVYCGEKSVAKLSVNHFKRASAELDFKTLDPYIFLTSRYFSAFDIKLDFKPEVIMITDVYTADHSILDPSTEVIQIAGRFRNGINTLTHIANFDDDLQSKKMEEGKAYLNGVFDTHRQVVELLKRLDSESSAATLQFFLRESPTSDFYTEAGHINDFMVDNFLYEQRVKGYYQSLSNLTEAYEIKPDHFNPVITEEKYLIGDKERVFRKGRPSIKEQQKETFRQLDRFQSKKPGSFIIHNSYDLIRNLRSLYPALTEIYDVIGFEGMVKANFSTVPMLKYKKRAEEVKVVKRLESLMNKEFTPNSERFDVEITSILPLIYKEAGVNIKPVAAILSEFYQIKRTTRSGKHATIIGDKKDLSNLSHFD